MIEDAQTDAVEIWIVSVTDLLDLWNPFQAWLDEPVTTAEINTAIQQNRLDCRPFETVTLQEEERRQYHVERIAWLVPHRDDNPITIDVGAPSLGYPPRRQPFDFIDGNHRLCAAAYRGDPVILVAYDGECSAMPDLFPQGIIYRH